MQARRFGKAEFSVSAVGLGAGHIGGDDVSEDEVARLLGAALDAGITLIDTARGYGRSEERIGAHLSKRRGEYVLSSKCGYGIEGVPDWTGECIDAGVDAALVRLRTDHIDVMHLHSCPSETFAREDIQRAMERAHDRGKVRMWAYSGENDALEAAIASGRFRAIQTSVNVCDQAVLDRLVPAAVERGLGVIAKRPLANAPWRFEARPTGDYAETYWERLQAMKLDPGQLAWDEWALRFAAFAPGVSSAIVGTRNLEHLKRAIAIVEKGPLPKDAVTATRTAFAAHGRDWLGQV